MCKLPPPQNVEAAYLTDTCRYGNMKYARVVEWQTPLLQTEVPRGVQVRLLSRVRTHRGATDSAVGFYPIGWGFDSLRWDNANVYPSTPNALKG